jgi:hypothetical protein
MTPTAQALSAPAESVDSTGVDWIPLALGELVQARPLNEAGTGWVGLVRLVPGASVSRHCHSGAVRGSDLGDRGDVVEDNVVIVPGTFTFDPVGTTDSLVVEGDKDLVMHSVVDGPVDYVPCVANS